MNLKELHKQKIIKEVFTNFGNAWSILIHDKITIDIINLIFKKSDLIDFNITALFSIGEERPNWDIPAMYFVDCTKEIARKINSEFKSGKCPSIKVFSLRKPEGLDPGILCTVVNIDIKIVEERIFECHWDSLSSLANILDARLNINFIGCTRKIAQDIESKLVLPQNPKNEIPILILDRSMDLFTPLMYFFSFRSILAEVGTLDCSDEYYKEIRNKHIGDVSKHLQYTVMKLQESIKQLNKKNVNVDALDTLVLEAPKNIELKKNIEKYSVYLEKCFQKLETVRDLANSQQNLVLERDKDGNQVRVSLDLLLPYIVSPELGTEDSVGLIFLLKAKGISFTDSESRLLQSKRFSKEDITITFNRRNQWLSAQNPEYKYDISRYEPMMKEVVETFAGNGGDFQSLSQGHERATSLRKSTMINVGREHKRTIAVFIKNGLTFEEMGLAYSLSESLGMDILFGSDKIMTRRRFVEEFRSNKELHEKTE